jgi:hypothetical protein
VALRQSAVARGAVAPESPPTVMWDQFYALEQRRNQQGRHKLFVGPTQSGKTVLARLEARLRSYVVVLGTKPVDDSLDEYEREGYLRIDHWPPTNKEKKDAGAPDSCRLLLWPEIKKREQLRSPKIRDTFLALFDQAFIEGHWTIVVDEALWVARRSGLDLDQALADMAYGSASNKVSLYITLQRPSGVSRLIWANCAEAYIFHSGVRDDVRELASLGIYQPPDVVRAMTQLGTGENHHPFLYLPCRAGGATWAISEAQL